jgi:hypothetical protein
LNKRRAGRGRGRPVEAPVPVANPRRSERTTRSQRPGEPPTIRAAKDLFNGLFFDPKRYDLSPVGRLKLNKRLGLDVGLDFKNLLKIVIQIVKNLVNIRIPDHDDLRVALNGLRFEGRGGKEIKGIKGLDLNDLVL